jgi:nucleotide-binding universal stress UspA family protein
MRSLRTILVATDLFQTREEVLVVADRFSQLFEARIHLLHVVKRHTDLHVADFPMTQLAADRLNNVKQKLLEHGADVELIPPQYGVPAEVILKQAEILDVDLIVMGCGGQRGESSPAIGPVAEAVLQRARQPVLAVFPEMAKTTFKRILCPVDHSNTSRRGLKNAIRLAEALESELVVLSVVPEIGWLAAAMEVGEFRHAVDQHDRHWREEFNTFLQDINFGAISWRRTARSGNVPEQIVQSAAEEAADLIVMGATGRTGVIRVLLGSVTRAVLRRLPCSIMTVKDENLIDEFTEEDADVVELLVAEAEALMEVKSYEAAVAKFDQVLAHHPFHTVALSHRADALEHLGDAERALRSRRRAALLQRIRSNREPTP